MRVRVLIGNFLFFLAIDVMCTSCPISRGLQAAEGPARALRRRGDQPGESRPPRWRGPAVVPAAARRDAGPQRGILLGLGLILTVSGRLPVPCRPTHAACHTLFWCPVLSPCLSDTDWCACNPMHVGARFTSLNFRRWTGSSTSSARSRPPTSRR